MIGEHEKEGRKMLKLALSIINSINAYDFNGSNSGGNNWLETKAVTLHGGEFGAKFKNIHWMVKDYDKGTPGDQNFLKKLSNNKKCADFSFAFKLFKGNMRFASVPLTTAEWKTFLYNGTVTSGGAKVSYDFHLKHVKSLLTNATYHGGVATDYRNIIFIGDDADGSTNMWKNPQSNNSFWALREIFNENNWNGFMFGVPFNLKIVRMLHDDGTENEKVYGGGNTSLKHWQFWKSNVLNIDNVEDINYNLYPNPLKGKFVFLNIGDIQKQDILIYDINGKKISLPINKTIKKLIMLDISSLQSGLYFIKTTFDGSYFTKKLVIN